MRAVCELARAVPDDDAWDSFVAASPEGHLLQTTPWGALKSRFGWQVERVALCSGKRIVAGAQVLYRSFPLGQTLAYVPKGPLVDWNDDRAVSAVLAALRDAAHRRRAFCLKLEPDLPDTPGLAQILSKNGLRRSLQSVQPRSTLLIELKRDEEEILASMKPKTRYNIRLASRKGVVVRDGTLGDLPVFQDLIAATSRRDHFTAYGPRYYRAAFELFVPGGHARLLLATFQGTVLAGIFVFAFGNKAWYMYGASGSIHRNLMPNHLLQWEAIRWARERGCATYDLWGIPDQVGDQPERHAHAPPKCANGLWGVFGFKRGFGGRIVHYLGVYDDVLVHAVDWLYEQAVTLPTRVWGETWHRRVRAG
ncbi:MAG: peptidoglycan bridge formation glycyltransferase FemA/FemB family protein [Chloroflexi bacterium]|nr:peptidoglycan bridge formation glycyltransferase FemA/FemB family protein [Chloroflexota bacterium]